MLKVSGNKLNFNIQLEKEKQMFTWSEYAIQNQFKASLWYVQPLKIKKCNLFIYGKTWKVSENSISSLTL